MNIKFYFLSFIIIALMSSCNNKEEVFEESEIVESNNFQKDIKVYDRCNENYIVLQVTSDYSDSLDAYLEATEFALYLEADLVKLKKESKQLNNQKESNEIVFIQRVPSVFINILDENGIDKYALTVSRVKLKSTNPWSAVPFEAYDTTKEFLGVKNTAVNDLGVRFQARDCWLCGYDDVSMPNTRILYGGEKTYLEDYGDQYSRMRASFYRRANEPEPTKFITTNKSVYNQL